MLLIIGKKKRMSDNIMRFYNNIVKNEGTDVYPETDPQLAFDCLKDLILGEDWYITEPLKGNQTTTRILHEILCLYCSDYKAYIKNKAYKKEKER